MVVVGGVFYLLPSLQTSSAGPFTPRFTHQLTAAAAAEATSMLTTGNRDVCFFNDLCMFPLQTTGTWRRAAGCPVLTATGPYAVTWWAANNILSNVRRGRSWRWTLLTASLQAAYVIVGILTFSWIMWCKR